MEKRQTLYNTYVNAEEGNFDRVAIYTRDGEPISHKRLLDEIDKTAVALLEYKKDESFKIGIISGSSYQEAVFLLAASKIGAVSKYIDITKNVTEIGESVAESSIDILAMGAEFLPMEPIINPSELPVIVLDEVPIDKSNYIEYKTMIDKANADLCKAVAYKDNRSAVIINSSGTTGTPKPIELSDYAINAAVEKMQKTDYPLTKDNLLLKIIPSAIGMGLITTLYTGLILGVPIIYLGGKGPKEVNEFFVGLLNGYDAFLKAHGLSSDKKLLIFGSPLFFRTLMQMCDHLKDLSFIGCMLAGGSGMSKEELEQMDAVFASKGCKVPVLNGYGQNEMAGAVTLNQIKKNRRGSAGVAVAGTELLIVDLVSGEPVNPNTTGKVLERSESLFLQYENMEEQTLASFISVGTGKKWFNTNDVGYLDDDGFLFITGRTSRVIIRFDVKVSLDKIESKILMSKYVKEAGVISIKSFPYDTTVVFVTLNDEYVNENISPELIINETQKSKNPLNDLEMPDKFFIVKSLSYRSSGKIDYRALEKHAEEMSKE